MKTSDDDGQKESQPDDDSADSASWSTTEAHFQYGKIDAPSFAGGRSSCTKTLTLQHASGWKYGDNFFFVDISDDQIDDGYNDTAVYLEWYTNLGLKKLLDEEIHIGPISDVGLIAGINYGADANYRKWLPGVRLSWDVPGFTLFDTAVFALIDDTAGISSGGAPAETNTFLVDFVFILPLSLGRHDFSIEGHAEIAGPRRDELGNDVSWWFLAQPQFRYDLGKTMFNAPKKLFVGVEWQVFRNKLGDARTDENTVQALVVWRF